MTKYEENKAKLEQEFDKCFFYKGDDELISSCNSEYTLDANDFFVTDGMVNVSMMTGMCYPDGAMHSLTGYEFIDQHIAVRGASYLIICDVNENGRLCLDLRMDEPFVEEKTDEVLAKVRFIKGEYLHMNYYCKEWRGTDCVIENGTKLANLILSL